MAPRTPSKKALPKRSRVVPVKLARKTCLRCSKRVSADPTHRCGYKDFQKCASCVHKRKECEPVRTRLAVTTLSLLMVSQIPRKFVPEVNHLLTLARDLAPEEEDHEGRLAELEAAQKQYTKRVQAFIRKREKRGLKHRPSNTVEVSSPPSHCGSAQLTTSTGLHAAGGSVGEAE
jgi:hypothetical protein